MRALLVALLAVTLASACILSREGSRQERASDDAGGSEPSSPGAGGMITSAQGGAAGGGAVGGSGGVPSDGGGGSGASGGGVAGCPVGPGSSMVLVEHTGGDYCIDRTEVTSAHYAAFLLSAPSLSIAECAWKTSFVPRAAGNNCNATHYDPIGLPDRPVACVDWCDATAYCAWAGKRLCGAVGGGPSDFNAPGSADINEWYNACSGAGAQLYPYGDMYSATACVGDDFDGVQGDGATDNAVDVASLATCEGTEAGLYDMSGNVWEWENSCAATGQNDECHTRGGSFWDGPGAFLQCTGVGPAVHIRSFYNRNIGFRCCADPMP